MNRISEELLNKIKNSESIAIVTHKRPDGDALSSAMAIFWYLRELGIKEENIDVIIPSFLSDFNFVDGTEYIKKTSTKEFYDLVIIVDCANFNRIEGSKILKNAKVTICIDHHIQEKEYAEYNFVDESAVSCTSVLYELFSGKSLSFLRCVTIGILSDTSNLTLNVTEKCNHLIKELKGKGVNVDAWAKKLTESNSRTKFFIKLVMERGKFLDKGNQIYATYLLQSDLNEDEKDLKKLNHKAIISSLQSSINFNSLIMAVETDDGNVKASLRTFDPRIDLNLLCENLISQKKIIKGGGHSYSAGCKANCSYDELLKMLSYEIEHYM